MQRFRVRATRWLKRHAKLRETTTVLVVSALLFGAVYMVERNTMQIYYDDLLATIARGESKGNYNAYFGNTGNREIEFTSMSVAQVLDWQRQFIAEGHASSAVGKYQFINTTLAGLVREMNISRDEKFSPALQDRLAIRLIERRGVRDYMRGRISREQFAHNLSQEWAALPRVIGDGDPAASYYAGDGLNRAHVSVDEVLVAIESLQAPPRTL